MVYILKVTLAWSLFLLLFEVFYKSNGKFTVNRFYLLFAIAAGMLIPLFSLPVPSVVSTTQALYPTTLRALSAAPEAATMIKATTVAAPVATRSFDIWLILRTVYGIGIAFFAVRSLLEIGRIMSLILRKRYQVVAGHKVIVTGKNHAPYSFMGWIFIGDLHTCQPAELEYIIRHEAAHNSKKHWLDLLLLQLVCIALWFHPLIWRYRYLLQLQHEYEADALAARDDSYAYGHFLLQQTLLNGVPSIAHSFHFSPIKNRIKMLAKKQNQKPGAWKYILAIPALLGCTFLMAKTATNTESTQHGNVVTLNGNTFMLRGTDTSFYDRTSKTAVLTSLDPKFPWLQIRKEKQIVYEMNNEPVHQNEYLQTPATYGKAEMPYTDYLQKEFSILNKNTPDSLVTLNVLNIVVNKEGQVVYYDIRYLRPYAEYIKNESDPTSIQKLNSIVDKIITVGPNWNAATINGQPVNSLVTLGADGC